MLGDRSLIIYYAPGHVPLDQQEAMMNHLGHATDKFEYRFITGDCSPLLAIEETPAVVYVGGGIHANESTLPLLVGKNWDVLLVLAHGKKVEEKTIAALMRTGIAGIVTTRPPEAQRVTLTLYKRSDISRLLGASKPLTKGELKVLELIVKGHSTEEMAKHMQATVGTVKSHVGRLLGKCGVRSRSELVTLACRHLRNT